MPLELEYNGLNNSLEEYAMPMFEKLGTPSVFCNSLVIDEDVQPAQSEPAW